ncbi:flagellar basal body-associated FliL family protein [Butyrivibrio sp. AE3004]|uniref:flagellar basal body-associated FliL family protein n=1 Tax=Butyrivibrio sp. AE3004 TaxID=1506994 RepID=UPI000494BE59|nr:flagellar basal body-associated FliL family protein [Butyrivibrio sp. AE3004]
MKKNLLAIIILAILLINTGMTGFMMFTVMSTNNQAVALIGDIAAALQIEANGGENGQGFSGSASGNVDIANVDSYSIPDMTITLKDSGDGKSHYMLCTVVLSMDKSNPDYETYGTAESIVTYQDMIKSKITSVIGSYTLDEIRQHEEDAKATILEQIQELFGSNFIYEVNFSGNVYQ